VRVGGVLVTRVRGGGGGGGEDQVGGESVVVEEARAARVGLEVRVGVEGEAGASALGTCLLAPARAACAAVGSEEGLG
jgi:hypothetical protein